MTLEHKLKVLAEISGKLGHGFPTDTEFRCSFKLAAEDDGQFHVSAPGCHGHATTIAEAVDQCILEMREKITGVVEQRAQDLDEAKQFAAELEAIQ